MIERRTFLGMIASFFCFCKQKNHKLAIMHSSYPEHSVIGEHDCIDLSKIPNRDWFDGRDRYREYERLENMAEIELAMGKFYNENNNKPFIRYSGSLIQQNHSEPIKGHGYSLWNLKEREYTHVEIPNDY